MEERKTGGLHVLLGLRDRLTGSLYTRFMLNQPEIAGVDCMYCAGDIMDCLRQNTYDALVLEQMPPDSGGALMGLLRREPVLRPQFFIVITGVCDDNAMRVLRRYGATALVESPCQPRMIVSILRELALRSQPSPESAALYRWLIARSTDPMRRGLRCLTICVDLYLRGGVQQTKVLYRCCATQLNTTPNGVETAIRGLRAGTWLCAPLGLPPQTRLTNSRLIQLLAERKDLWSDS